MGLTFLSKSPIDTHPCLIITLSSAILTQALVFNLTKPPLETWSSLDATSSDIVNSFERGPDQTIRPQCHTERGMLEMRPALVFGERSRGWYLLLGPTLGCWSSSLNWWSC